MRGIISYIKRSIGWLCIVIVCEVIMIATMMLNEIAFAEILYGIFISLFLLLILLVFDAARYYRHYQKIKELEHSIMLSTDGMPETADLLENEYQKLLRILADEYTGLQSQAAARQKDMQEYYAMWVHQVKTPIAALRLLLQNKNEDGKMTEELSELFDIEQYVEMALQYQRLDSETTDFVFEETDLDEIIRGAVKKYARQFIAKKISLCYEPVETSVVTDKKWLSFVIEQVISNAVKYTKTGSIKIYLEDGDGTMSVPLPEIAHAKKTEMGNGSTSSVCLVIEDAGIGIRAEDLPRICEMGYTGCNGHEGQHSSGIGLYLCSRILKNLGHTFAITSKEGVGTVVKIG